MSLDKSSSGSGDQHPDKAPGPERRPFPGAPEDRPVPSKPAGYRSFEEIAADRAARAAGNAPGEGASGQAAAGRGAGRDTAGHGKGPADAGPGTGDAGLRGSAAAPGSRERTGAVPGNVPARGEDTRPVPRAPGGQDTGRPGIPGGRRPDAFGETDRPRLRPFPGAPEDRPVPSRPVAWRSFEEIRADRAARAGDTGTADRGSARPAERPASGQPVAKDAGRSGKDAPAEKSASGSDAGRDAGSREPSRVSRDQAGGRQAQERVENKERPAERPRAETVSLRKEAPLSPGADSHLAGGQQHRGDAPAPEAHRPGDKGVITHGHAEFHGQKLDLYTDGTRWATGDAVRAAAQGTHEHKPDAPRHEITEIPQMRGQGRNVVGEKEERSPGDTSDLPPTGKELLEEPGENISRADAFRRKSYEAETIQDVRDVVNDDVDLIDKLFARPPTSSHADVPVGHPVYGPAETAHANPADVITATLLVSTLAIETGRAVGHRVHNLKETAHEMIERHKHAGD